MSRGKRSYIQCFFGLLQQKQRYVVCCRQAADWIADSKDCVNAVPISWFPHRHSKCCALDTIIWDRESQNCVDQAGVVIEDRQMDVAARMGPPHQRPRCCAMDVATVLLPSWLLKYSAVMGAATAGAETSCPHCC